MMGDPRWGSSMPSDWWKHWNRHNPGGEPVLSREVMPNEVTTYMRATGVQLYTFFACVEGSDITALV